MGSPQRCCSSYEYLPPMQLKEGTLWLLWTLICCDTKNLNCNLYLLPSVGLFFKLPYAFFAIKAYETYFSMPYTIITPSLDSAAQQTAMNGEKVEQEKIIHFLRLFSWGFLIFSFFFLFFFLIFILFYFFFLRVFRLFHPFLCKKNSSSMTLFVFIG